MTTSIVTFRNEFTEGVLNFVWRQWCRMGVVGSMGPRAPWVSDPEPVLAFTTEVARHDARMFDEVLDWLARNGHWLNTQRLATVIKQDHVGDQAVLGAIASWMVEQDKSMKWRGLAQRTLAAARTTKEPLFHTAKGKSLRPPEGADAHFARYGLVRETVRPRGLTPSVNMKDPVNIVFTCRAVFGIGIRADVMAFLLTTEGAHPREVARTLGYNHMRVQKVLVGLAEAGVARVRPAGRAKQYWIDRDKWRSVLMGEQAATPRWVNWRALTRGLTAIWRAAWALAEDRADEYIFSSKMRVAVQSARTDLLDSGMGFTIEDDAGYVAEAYLPVFLRDAARLRQVLSEEAGAAEF
ncbi:MAG: hypothetical protein NTV49_12775 [Kiritimatiellaeota bacterium]|nr:hypothetical protein [Kiritimatiellota bacterium]